MSRLSGPNQNSQSHPPSEISLHVIIVELESIPWTKGGPKLSFLEKYKLDEESHPANWLNLLLPLTPMDNLELLEDVDVKGDKRNKFSVANWTAYTNTKAKISNAREWGHKLAGQLTDVTIDDVQ